MGCRRPIFSPMQTHLGGQAVGFRISALEAGGATFGVAPKIIWGRSELLAVFAFRLHFLRHEDSPSRNAKRAARSPSGAIVECKN